MDTKQDDHSINTQATKHALRFASLGSGSRGNATLIEKHRTCLLIDCGFSMTQIIRRLERLDKTMDDLSAILITHEHTDHISGASALAKKYNIPLWMTHGTASKAGLLAHEQIQLFHGHGNFEINDIAIEPYPVPHDAREPAQFVFSDGEHTLGLLTDVGSITPHIIRTLAHCDALIIEANHDSAMLNNGPYPYSLKERVGGHLGHLSNQQAGALLSQIDTAQLQHIVAAHLSGENNTQELARSTLSEALHCDPDWIAIAEQQQGLDWRALQAS